MKKNLKRNVAIVLIMIITVLCILSGIRTRHQAKLVITQLVGEGNGYVLETSKNQLIVIDGGTKEDTKSLKKIIQEKGNNQVLAWFITSPVSSNTGAFLEILKHHSEISIAHIYSSLNSGDWYEQTDLEETEIAHIKELMETITTKENLPKYIDLQRRVRYSFDNYFITPLELRDNQSTKIADQTIVLKVDNSFKSAVFFGNIGERESHLFFENDKDQFENELIQISTNLEEGISNELFDALKTDKIMISGQNKWETKAEIYEKKDEELTVEIW